jgi:hypothetical protein
LGRLRVTSENNKPEEKNKMENDETIKIIDELEMENQFGVTKAEAQRGKGFFDKYNLDDLNPDESAKFKILSDKVRVFDYQEKLPDPKTGIRMTKVGRTIEVMKLDDKKCYTLWLSAKSFSANLANIVMDNGGVMRDIYIQVTKKKIKTDKEVDGKKIGSMNVYNVVRIKPEGFE